MPGLDTDTIAAIATARGDGPVGIIRLSGPKALNIAEHITRSNLSARYAHYRSFHSTSDQTIDAGLALFFPKPHSFTGEDIVELQGHGGHVVLQSLLTECLSLGARSARAGEFSERAFANGKLDLLQAEAIADLITADTEAAAQRATASLTGVFSSLVNALSGQLNELRALTEASIDFPEEDIDVLERYSVLQRLTACQQTLEKLIGDVSASQRKNQGYTAVIVGAPNAGKSSLLNALVREDIAIVNERPGTTRDALKETINVGSVTLKLIDTAGIRDSNDTIEQEGIERAKTNARTADLILHVLDDHRPDQHETSWLPPGHLTIVVHNKIDLSGRSSGLVGAGKTEKAVAVSAETGAGLKDLEQTIEHSLLGESHQTSDFSARQRHVDALKEAHRLLVDSMTNYQHHHASELLAEDLKTVQTSIDSLTGRISSDDILGQIFSTFCIGK